MLSRNTMLAVLIAVIAVGIVYMLDPTFFGLLGRRESFADVTNSTGAGSSTGMMAGQNDMMGVKQKMEVVANSHNVGGNISSNMPASEPAPAPAAASHGNTMEGFADLEPETMPFPAGNAPANCYPKNQLKPDELLPGDPNSKWAQVNPSASGDIAGKNFLSAGALIGVNTVGQSNRNANWDIRAAPPNPQVVVSPWLNTTISPDLSRRPLDIA